MYRRKRLEDIILEILVIFFGKIVDYFFCYIVLFFRLL